MFKVACRGNPLFWKTIAVLCTLLLLSPEDRARLMRYILHDAGKNNYKRSSEALSRNCFIFFLWLFLHTHTHTHTYTHFACVLSLEISISILTLHKSSFVPLGKKERKGSTFTNGFSHFKMCVFQKFKSQKRDSFLFYCSVQGGTTASC